MSHIEQRRFLSTVAEFFPRCFVDSRVLEIGSLDVNGSARSFFNNCDYTGVDVAPGPGVDVVCGGHEYDEPDGSFDIVLSMETMEHNPYWVGTVTNMLRLCRTGGMVFMSCASLGRPEHATARSDPQSSPLTIGLGWDYYRNLSEAQLRKAVASTHYPVLAGYWTNWHCQDLYMVAVKGATTPEVNERFASMDRAIDAVVRRDNRALRPTIKRLVLGQPYGETIITSLRRLRRMGWGA